MDTIFSIHHSQLTSQHRWQRGRRRARPDAAAVGISRRCQRWTVKTCASTTVPGSSSKVDTTLSDWICSNGGHVAGAQLVYEYDEGGRVVDRQLLASKDLSPGDRIMLVPRALQVRDTGTPDPLLAALMERVPKGSGSGRGAWQFKMALQLIQYMLQGREGTHYPYVQQLPGVAPGVPVPTVAMLLPESVLSELQHPQLAADAAGQAFFCRQFAGEVLARLPGTAEDPFGGQRVDEGMLSWGLALAMSRSFGFRQSPGHGMVPLVDMANHSFESNAEIRADEDGAVTMIANKQVKSGEPLLLRYGTHSNADLLLSYGFVMSDNPFDTYSFGFDVDFVLGAIQQFVGSSSVTPRPSDGLKTWQRTQLADMGLLHTQQQHQRQQKQQQQAGAVQQLAGEPARGGDQAAAAVVVSIGGDPPVSGPLLAACRVMLAEDRKAVKSRTAEELGDWDKPINAAHEAIVMKALVGLCTILYKSFPTSIQQDTKLLATPTPESGRSGADSGSASSNGSGSGGGSGLLSTEGGRVAVQYRLAMKRGLEASTRTILLRMKELLGG